MAFLVINLSVPADRARRDVANAKVKFLLWQGNEGGMSSYQDAFTSFT